MNFSRTIGAALALAGYCATAHADGGTGLRIDPDDLQWPRWQGRLSLTASAAAGRAAAADRSSQGLGSLSLMSDYYLTGSLLGPKRAGGFRATSGVLIGPRSQAWAGSVPSGAGGTFSIDRSLFGQAPLMLPGDAATDAPTLPYLGVGYTGLSPRGGWSFHADLGLVSLSPGGAVKFGRVFTGTQSLDETLRDMRWSPVFQLGVSYHF
ncbi:MAG: hypothetical protein ABI809_08665 [Caldimonas sp.]